MNITQRDRNVLLAGFIFVVCYLLFFFVAEPIYKKQAKADGQIKNKIQFIQKYYEILNQKSYYQEKEKAKYIEGMLAVPIEISVRCNLKNLSLFLMRIENNEKLLIIEELQLRRINKTDPDDLQTRLKITGFIQKLEPQDGKSI